MLNEIKIRLIEQPDNAIIAAVIRQSLLDFNAAKPGTVYYDDSTDHLFELFQKPKAKYYIAEWKGEIVGGGGIYPTAMLPSDVCELVKLYLRADCRGKGWGKVLLELCLNTARELGYKQVYLETMPELKIAIPLYEKYGFECIAHSMGNSTHSGCGIWMLKSL